MLSAHYLPPVPVPDAALRITRIETCRPKDLFPGLVLCRIHTDQGLIGCGESYYIPEAVEAVIHDWFRHRLLGADALAIESHWRFLYERAANFGVRGAELRALSAVDLALWDILGQVTGQPVYRLLGGPVRERVRVYNSCGSPSYGPEGASTRGPAWRRSASPARGATVGACSTSRGSWPPSWPVWGTRH